MSFLVISGDRPLNQNKNYRVLVLPPQNENTTAVKFDLLFFKTELFIYIFARGKCPIAKGFIDACVVDSVMQALTVVHLQSQ